MRSRCLVLAVVLALAAQPVMAERFHAAFAGAEPPFKSDAAACPNAPDGLVGYLGDRRVCANTMLDALKDARGINDASIPEVVLLTSRPNGKTLYRVDAERRPVLALAGLHRPEDRPLVIRGQRDAEGRHLVWLKGLDLIDTICDPARVLDAQACREGRPVPTAPGESDRSFARRYEMMSLAMVEQARMARLFEQEVDRYEGVTARGPRTYCVRLRNVSGVRIADLGFEDCWIAAISAVNTRRVTLDGVRIHGSTFGLLAIATKGYSPDTHSFVISNSHWIQSPAAYRSDATPCASPHRDLSCALDIWSDIPWGVTHAHLWRPLNGALFAGYNIAGNVLIEGNLVERAYNAIRIISERPRTGRNVEIRGNRFRFIRDNAVEPEARAEGWIIKHNVFENVHAWISTDGVSGKGFYVFGNVAFYDPANMPGTNCSDDVEWAASPGLQGLAGDSARYVPIDASHDPSSVACRGHYRGAILKTGDSHKTSFPYIDRISIFNNSWRTRSPLWGNKHASPLSHFNNLIEFTGCGLDGPWHCRQVPTPPEYCGAGNERTRGRVALPQFWTDDGGALVADCVSLVPGPVEPDERVREVVDVEHVFCRDLYNRPFKGLPYTGGACHPHFEADAIRFEEGRGLVLIEPRFGCRLQVADGAVLPDCEGIGPQIGALQQSGHLLDLEISGAGYLGRSFRP